MERTNRIHTAEFKQEVVRLVVEQGRKVPAVAQELGISPKNIYHWLKQYKEHGKDAFPGKGHLMPHDEEIRKLKKELADVAMERDILKKAVAIFSKQPK